jgi:hypothetical protein
MTNQPNSGTQIEVVQTLDQLEALLAAVERGEIEIVGMGIIGPLPVKRTEALRNRAQFSRN